MSTSRAPLQRDGLAFRLAPLLSAGSLRITEGSPLLRAQRPPSGLRRCCQRLPCSGDFSPGPGGLRQFRYNPSLRAAVITPLDPVAVSAILSTTGTAFAKIREARHPETCLTRLARRSIPTAHRVAPRAKLGFVRRHRPRLSAAKRLLSFMVLALSTLGLSPTGLYRLLWSRQIPACGFPALGSSRRSPKARKESSLDVG